MPSLFEAYGIEQETLAPPTPAKPPKADTLRKIADIGVSGAQGVVGGVKMLSDVFGADNAVSGALGAANEGLGNLLSPARMAELQNRQRLIKEAEESGTTLDQVKANIGGFFEAPVATVMQGLGSIAPSVAAMLIPGGQGVAGANLLRTATMLGLGAGQGAGAVKGSIYDGTKRELLEAGASPEEAEARATNAQAYGGPNSGQIGLGAGVGAVAGRFGAEGAIERIAKGVGASPKALVPRVAGGVVTEGSTEAFQGGQERYAVNQALNNEGFQVDPFKGVAGNAALEGLVGGAIGGGLNLPAPKQVEVSPGDLIRQNLQPETGALAKAVNAGIEAQARQADATGVLPGAEPVTEPEPIDDPFRDRITALPEGPKQEALRAYAVVNNPNAPKGVLNYNRKLLDRIFKENAPPPDPFDINNLDVTPDYSTELGAQPEKQSGIEFDQKEIDTGGLALVDPERAPLPPTDTDVAGLLGEPNPDPLRGALQAVQEEFAANQNLANWMERATPFPVERAQELQTLAREQRGLDMAVVPHSSGSGFTVIPAQWVTPAMRNLVGGAPPFDNAPTGAIRVDAQGNAAPETRPQQLATAAENQRRTDLGLPITARIAQGAADVSTTAPVGTVDTGLAGPTNPEPAGGDGAGAPLAADGADGVLPVAGTPAPSSEPGVAVGTALAGNSLTNGEVDGAQADQAQQTETQRPEAPAAVDPLASITRADELPVFQENPVVGGIETEPKATNNVASNAPAAVEVATPDQVENQDGPGTQGVLLSRKADADPAKRYYKKMREILDRREEGGDPSTLDAEAAAAKAEFDAAREAAPMKLETLDSGRQVPLTVRVRNALISAKQKFAGKQVTNASDGLAIEIPASGLKHAMSGKVSEAALAALEKVDELVRTAKFSHATPDKKGRNTIKEVRFYDREAVLDGKPVNLRVVVRVAPDGRRYYDHFEIKEKAPAGLSGKRDEPDSAQPFTEASSRQSLNDPGLDASQSDQIEPPADSNGPSPFSRQARNDLGQFASKTNTIRQIVQVIASRWDNPPGIEVISSLSEAPREVIAEYERQNSQGADGEAEGFYHRGKVYLVASALNTPADVTRVLFHETLGHAGLRGVFGDALAPILDQIATLRGDLLRPVAEKYGFNLSDRGDRLKAAEEVLAFLAQTKPEIGYVKRAIAAIRTWLRANIPGLEAMKLSDAEIVNSFILPARQFVERGRVESEGQRVGGAVAPAFSRVGQVNGGQSQQLQIVEAGEARSDRKNVVKELLEMRGVYRNESTGWDIQVARGGLEKVASGATPQELAASLKLPELLRNAVLVESRPDTRGVPEIKAIHRMYAPVRVDGTTYRAKLTVKEFSDGRRLYDQSLTTLEMQNPAQGGAARIGENVVANQTTPNSVAVGFADSSPTEMTVGDLMAGVKRDDGTSVFSRTAGATSGAWDGPGPSRFDDFVYKAQDKLIDTKRVMEAIKKTTGQISDDLNVYLQEELFHGRAAKRTEDFGAQELQPLLEQLQSDGLSIGDVEEYLHARHAKEANALIASREPGMPDGGSGMTDQAADDYFAKLSPADTAKLSAAALQVDSILAKTRQMYADYGLESQATVDGWAKMFKSYVPLMREDKSGAGMGIGQGFSVKGKEVKGRTGSTRKVVDILANIAMQRERVIVRGEKNRVAVALVGLAAANPNGDFWSVGPPPAERVYDPKKDAVVERADPMFKARDNVLVAKVKGANGEVTEQAVVFNENDPRALRMAASLKNLDAGALEGLLGASAKVTRYFSSINTQYNPVFGIVNLIRDVQGALINLADTPLAGKQAKIAVDTASALRGIYGNLRSGTKNQWSDLWQQFQEDGGQTGYRDLFRTSQDRAEALQRTLTPDAWADSKLGQIFTAGGALKVPMIRAKQSAGWIFDWLSDYNNAMENSVRLASYKSALDQGMSREQAASLAKNLTVNFNRKGQIGQQAGALYAFFNAAMQGTAKMGQVLLQMDGGNPKTLRLSPVGKKVVYGGMLLGATQALALAAAGFDDDDPPEFLRERSLIIPLGDKKYFSIPMPLGLHVIPGLGRHATEFALSGFAKPAKRAVDVIGMFADAFNPVGNAGLSIQTIAPTIIDPLVALKENKDFAGRPIARTSSNPAVPGFTQWKDSATAPAKWLAEAINWVSGGNDYVAGVLSPTPDQIDYLFAQVTGGVGRELSKVENTVKGVIQGEEVASYKVPLFGRFYGNARSQASEGNAFYANNRDLNELETQIKAMRKDGKFDEAIELQASRPDAYLIRQANMAERQVQRLRREKREMIESGADRELIRVKEEQITGIMARLNRAVERQRELAEQ